MDDRKLLELAAKAVGAYWFGHYRCWYLKEGPWNPLEDDGDALRLAVRLKLRVGQGSAFAVCYAGFHPKCNDTTESYSAHGGDEMAATRRAIVRAAAAIGEKME